MSVHARVLDRKSARPSFTLPLACGKDEGKLVEYVKAHWEILQVRRHAAMIHGDYKTSVLCCHCVVFALNVFGKPSLACCPASSGRGVVSA
jgi:hypothetical protein